MVNTEGNPTPTSVDALLEVIRVQAAEIDRLRATVPRLESEIGYLQRDLYRANDAHAQAVDQVDQMRMQNTLRDAAAPPKVAPSPRPDDPAAAIRTMLDAMLGHPKVEKYAESQAALLDAAARALNAHASKEENDQRVAERDKTIAEQDKTIRDLRAENCLRVQIATGNPLGVAHTIPLPGDIIAPAGRPGTTGTP